jgi:hypothetical protein
VAAGRDWHTRARVRLLTDHECHSVDPCRERRFELGEELMMVQWGRGGRPVDRGGSWTSFDIDGAFIVSAEKVEVLEILDEVSPE